MEQSLWLALLAGKVEALGQSSQSKCESSRLKGHFPSSSPVWKGAIQRQCQFIAVLYFRDNTDNAVAPRLLSLMNNTQTQTSRVDRVGDSNGKQ